MKERLGLVGLGVVLSLLFYQLLDQGTIPPSIREQEALNAATLIPIAAPPAARKAASVSLH